MLTLSCYPIACTQWEMPKVTPSTGEIEIHYSGAFQIAVLASIKLSIYTFEGKIYREGEGGPTGHTFTGDLAMLE